MVVTGHQALGPATLDLAVFPFAETANTLHVFQGFSTQEGRKQVEGHFTLLQLRQVIGPLDQGELGIGTIFRKGGVFPGQRKTVELTGGNQGVAFRVTKQPFH